jgi:hypothetical protein
MKKLLFILVPIVLIAILGVWFWSLASVPDEERRTVILTVQEQGVSVREPGAAEWRRAEDGMEIGQGWSVRTDGSGRATIGFFGQGESRLDGRTEVTVTSAMLDEMNSTGVNVELDLGMGRVWSRVLRILDLDGSYAVRTSSVVATVRGTAFEVRQNADGSSEVTVNESAVEVGRPGAGEGSPDAVAEGFAVTFASDGSMGEPREIPYDATASPWFRQNGEADIAFVERERELRIQALRRLDGPRPDGMLSGAAALSERLHLALAKDDERARLAERYLARRYMRLIELVGQGKAGMAAQEFARLDNYIRTRLKGPEGEEERARISAALKRVSFLVEDADPDSALFPFKQRMENLTEALTESDEGRAIFARLLSLGARLDEAGRLIARGAHDEARMALDGAATGIENASREAAAIMPRLSAERRRAIHGKIAALRERERALRLRLERALAPPEPEETAASTEDVPEEPGNAETHGPSQVNPPDSNAGSPQEPADTSPAEPANPEFESITFFVQPDPVRVGETASLMVVGKRPDGSEQNVSARSTFALGQAIGTLNGPTFTPSQEGSTVITASYEDSGHIHSASATVTARGEVVLESLTLVSSAGTALKSGQSSTFTAQANYSNGYSKDVTALTELYLASGAGALNGKTYTAGREQGNAEIIGSFTENGKTAEGSVVLTVQ